MKRYAILVIVFFLALSLCACSPSQESYTTYTVQNGETVYTVDTENCTISDGTNVYRYEGTIRSVNITYPDGSTYWWHTENTFSYGGWSDDYDPDRYVAGDVLRDVLRGSAPAERSSKNGPLIFLLLAVGILNTVSPSMAWYLQYGWRFKDAEPSDMALGLNRVGGIAALVIAVIMILV